MLAGTPTQILNSDHPLRGFVPVQVPLLARLHVWKSSEGGLTAESYKSHQFPPTQPQALSPGLKGLTDLALGGWSCLLFRVRVSVFFFFFDVYFFHRRVAGWTPWAKERDILSLFSPAHASPKVLFHLP